MQCCSFSSIIMQNAIIIYLLFLEYYLLLNGIWYKYCIFHLWQFSVSTWLFFRIPWPRVNDSLFSHFFKTLEELKIENSALFLFIQGVSKNSRSTLNLIFWKNFADHITLYCYFQNTLLVAEYSEQLLY